MLGPCEGGNGLRDPRSCARGQLFPGRYLSRGDSVVEQAGPRRKSGWVWWGRRARVISVGVALFAACTGSERQLPPLKLAGGRVVDLIPLSLSGETWQDAEPFLALYA